MMQSARSTYKANMLFTLLKKNDDFKSYSFVAKFVRVNNMQIAHKLDGTKPLEIHNMHMQFIDIDDLKYLLREL